MRQFIQSAPFFQEQFSEQRSEDLLLTIPCGMAWFDALPIAEIVGSKSLTLAVYPNQSLLKNHEFRLKLMGLKDSDFAALTQDAPPHFERDVWERVNRMKLPLLLLTAGKLKSMKALSILAPHPGLKAMIIEHGHLLIPDLWGPAYYHEPYNALPELFKEQWQGHPSLFVSSYPLAPQYQALVASKLGLKDPKLQTFQLSSERLEFKVQCCITQYQKLKTLLRFIPLPGSDMSQTTIIVCHSLKEIALLEKHLAPMDTILFHHNMEADEKERALRELLSQKEPMVLVESSLMSELPTHLFSSDMLRIVHWQMPWSLEAMIQTLLPSLHPLPHWGRRQGEGDIYSLSPTGGEGWGEGDIYSLSPTGGEGWGEGEANPYSNRLEVLLLYTKEDYINLNNRLSVLSRPAATSFNGGESLNIKPIRREHLSRLRHFAVFSDVCRKTYLQNYLNDSHSDGGDCKSCDTCKNQDLSSLWRNLLNHLLY